MHVQVNGCTDYSFFLEIKLQVRCEHYTHQSEQEWGDGALRNYRSSDV